MGFHIGIACVLVLGSTLRGCGPARPQPKQNQEVYARAIDAIFREDVDVRHPRNIQVFTSSATVDQFPQSSYQSRVADSAGRRVVWDEIPIALRDSLQATLGQPTKISPEALPPEAHTRDDRDSTGIVLSVSPVAYTTDSAQALVYIEVHCGGLCGGADIIYLRKIDSAWVIAGTFPLWRS